jgi:hypothetical protein
MTLMATPEGIELNTAMLWAIFPAVALLAVAAYKHWDPLW